MEKLYAEAEEKTFIGLVLNNADVLDVYPLAPEWFDPAHGHQNIMRAVVQLRDAGAVVNPLAVLEQLTENGEATSIGGRQGAVYLSELYTSADLGSGSYCARKIGEAFQRRTLLESVLRMKQKLENSDDFAEALDLAAKEVLNIQVNLDDPLDEGPIEGLSSLKEFLSRPVKGAEWVIPHVLKRQERVIFLAPPGVGKSTLARQSAILLAAGKHPFWPDLHVPVQRTLLVDLENPPDIVAKKTRPEFEKMDIDKRDDVFIYHQPGGIDVRSAKGARLLERVVAQVKPAVMFIGPLYKLAKNHGDGWEVIAEDTARVLDRIRTKYDCALWIEHHMPKASMGAMNKTPFGSSLWERWPEFGFILSKKEGGTNEYVMEPYRPGRDERAWPMELIRSSTWPWVASFNHENDALFRDETRRQNAAWSRV